MTTPRPPEDGPSLSKMLLFAQPAHRTPSCTSSSGDSVSRGVSWVPRRWAQGPGWPRGRLWSGGVPGLLGPFLRVVSHHSGSSRAWVSLFRGWSPRRWKQTLQGPFGPGPERRRAKSVRSCRIGPSASQASWDSEAEKDATSPPEVKHTWTEREEQPAVSFLEKSIYYLYQFPQYHKSTSGDKTVISGKRWGQSRWGPPTRRSRQGSRRQCSAGSPAKEAQRGWRVTKTPERPGPKRKPRAHPHIPVEPAGDGAGLCTAYPGSCLPSVLLSTVFMH